MDVDLTTARWIKSSYSQQGGNCVEWAPVYADADGIVPIRDSKSPGGPVLHIPATAFTAFVAGVKDGALDTP
ncbi:DUF397 domain-containing protein [Streptomyces uncialis]|uniref:DUF397 domain-containing protein n=1 Tax=Streptomyces uncialis TaxID=1048205 RepID=UPI0037F5123F